MAALLSLQNRWEIFNIDEESGIDSKLPTTEPSEMKSITNAAAAADDDDDDDEDTGTWQVDNAGSRRKWKPKRKIFLELPSDALHLIFTRLTPLQILGRAQWVCSSWWKASKQPYLFRSLDLRHYWKSSQTPRFINMAMTAVDHSCGELQEFSIADYDGKDLLNYVLEKSNSIKRLRFVKCNDLDDDLLLKFAKKFSDLEELELGYCWINVDAIAEVGRICANLTCFKWVGRCGDCDPHGYYENRDAFEIAKNMPKLRLLQFTSGMTDHGLQAILKGCSDLEYLDLRRCGNINRQGETWQNCVRKISHLRHPNESVDDWHYALKRCHQHELKYDSIYRFDSDFEEKEKSWEDCIFKNDEAFENQIFLPPKSVTCYL